MTRNVIPLRADTAGPVAPSPMVTALDELEHAAGAAGVLYVDVQVQLALARHLVDLTATTRVGAEPTVAQVHALRELRLVVTELRELVVHYSTTGKGRT